MLDRYSLRENSFMNWIKSIIKPDNTHWHIESMLLSILNL
jgi:hypothetical protein